MDLGLEIVVVLFVVLWFVVVFVVLVVFINDSGYFDGFVFVRVEIILFLAQFKVIRAGRRRATRQGFERLSGR